MSDIQDGSAVFQILDKRKENLRQEFVDLVYPVGIVVALANDKKPAFMNYGTWEKVAENRVLQGASDSNAPGKKIEPGLPNITGKSETFDSDTGWMGNMGLSGAFTNTDIGKKGYATSNSPGTYEWYRFEFDASKSNEIYGASDTVQPAAYVVAYWQRTA